MAKRGRPKLAAPSLEIALRAVSNGSAPKRPRNDFERVAAGQRRGRPRDRAARTRIAAELADYLMKAEALRPVDAVRRACAAFCPPVDGGNVRKYLRRMNPTVLCHWRGPGFPGFPTPASIRQPFLAYARELTPEELRKTGLPVVLRLRVPPISR